MKDKYICPMHPEVVSNKPGKCPKCHMNLVEKSKLDKWQDHSMHHEMRHSDHQEMNHTAEGLYTCPMDPEILQNTPGDCPKCGMKLIPLHNEAHAGHENMEEGFKKRFFWAIPLVLIVVILSPMLEMLTGIMLDIPFANIISFILTTILVFYFGWPFYQMAAGEIKARQYGMMTLVSLAVLSGYFFSVGATFFFEGESLFAEVATLVLAFLFGHWMEMRSVRGATGALSELAKLVPSTAHKLEGKEIIDVQTSSLKIGNVVIIKPGEKIPVDGEVIEGTSSVNEALFTGESAPVDKKKGDSVIGGTINNDGTLTVEITKMGSETAIAQMMQLIQKAQTSKPQVQKLADKAASMLTFIALTLGIATFIYWLLINPQGAVFAGTLAISVIVIACPHALGLAIPTVTTITTALAAKNGILIQDMNAIEVAKNLNYVVFDKTGTLTKGEFGVTDIIGKDKNKILKLAAAVEYYSQHSIAQGILKEMKNKKIQYDPASKFKSFPGKGAYGVVGKDEVLIGNAKLMEENSVSSSVIDKDIQKIKEAGKTFIYLAVKSSKEKKFNLLGVIALEDIIRKESKETINSLHSIGIKTAMLTGDNEDVAKQVASKLGIDTVFAQVLPEDKVNKIKQLQDEGNIVAMVGDGVNDAAALTQANVGIAIGAGTQVAINSAEIVLVKDDPRDVVKAINLSKKTSNKMLQNLVWAAGYNIIAMPLAAGVLYQSYGLLLRPEWSALIMSASSVIVVANALTLRKAKI